MALESYKKKRNFKITSEPEGVVGKGPSGHMFVVQEHHASHLHYDFRLELDGVLKSWAIPKGPSLDPAIKRLAMEVEDHPLNYGDFEGEIPAGQYGGGHVIVWDTGTWEVEGDAKAAYKKGHLRFSLKGKKLKGSWSLIRTARKEGSKNQWLLIKKSDTAAKPGSDIVAEKPKSVLSHRSIRDVPLTKRGGPRVEVTGESHVWKGKKKVAKRTLKKKSIPALAPELAKLVSAAPQGDEWIHEIKFDGYRTLCHLNGDVRFYTREGLDWTHRYGDLSQAFASLKLDGTVIDGEIVVLDDQGHSDFQALQNALSAEETDKLVFFAFDLLYLHGKDVRGETLLERKSLLEVLLKKIPKTSPLRFSSHELSHGAELFKSACQLHLEGIISKKIESTYEEGRNGDWVKTKCEKRQEVVIGGWSDPQGSRKGIGALLLGVMEGNKLRYVGKTGTGFSHQSLLDLYKRLKSLEQRTSPFSVPPRLRGVHWVKPELAAEVKFATWTSDGNLRQASFQGLREDKPVKKIIQEKEAAEVTLTHPDKVMIPDAKVTKQDLADYYLVVAKAMLTLMGDRPLTLVRCPGGGNKTCFYQKHDEKTFSNFLERTEITQEGKNKETRTYLSVNTPEGLRVLVQMGVLEIHTWVANVEDPLRPDEVIFDLDPDPGVTWSGVIKAAKELRDLLADLKLESFIKLSGGKGVHIHVPIDPKYSWDEIKAFSRTIADALEERAPERYTANSRKNVRKGKIFIDYLRNGFGASAVAPYSVRNRKGAPVACPIEWKELSARLKPDGISMKKAMARIRAKKNPWKRKMGLRQKIAILETK